MVTCKPYKACVAGGPDLEISADQLRTLWSAWGGGRSQALANLALDTLLDGRSLATPWGYKVHMRLADAVLRRARRAGAVSYCSQDGWVKTEHHEWNA